MTHSQTAIPTEREDNSHEAPLATPNALSERRVGIEVEFGGLSARVAARLIQDHAGGELEELDPHRFMLHGTSLGELKLELDSKFAHGKLGASALEKSLRDFVGLVSDPIVPTELITNPLPVSKIGALDEMLAHPQQAGSRRNRPTASSLWAASQHRAWVQICRRDSGNPAGLYAAGACSA